jgi:hypothetical protein
MKKPTPAAQPAEELSRDRLHLGYADTRINGLSVNAPGSTELARVRAARDEILGRMSAGDVAAYRKASNAAKTPEARAEEAKDAAEPV